MGDGVELKALLVLRHEKKELRNNKLSKSLKSNTILKNNRCIVLHLKKTLFCLKYNI